MRRGLLFSIVVLAMVTASASAVDITVINSLPGSLYASNGTDGYNVAGLSDDGLKVACTSDTAARYWDMAANNWSASLLATAMSHGVATWVGDGSYNTINAVGYKASAANPIQLKWNRNGPAGIHGGGYLKVDTFNCIPSSFNSVTVDYNSGTGWLVGHLNSSTGKGVAYKLAAGNVGSLTWSAALGTSYSNGGLNGASNAGVVVGQSNSLGPIMADADHAGAVLDITPFAGADAAGGSGIAVSANATLFGTTAGYVGGYFKTSAWRNAFRSDLSLGTAAAATRLLPVDGAYNGTGDEAEAFDVSNNGIAIGYDNVGGVKTAVVWLPGATQAVTLQSIMLETLPADNSISRLSAAVSITADPKLVGGKQVYTIAGQAVLAAGGTTGFVATILPEPATLGFLVLGSMALLRRRR